MRIAVLTYYKVANFGANLQAVSTYLYLKKNGHEPIFVNYCSKEVYNKLYINQKNQQTLCHFDFVDGIISQQSELCFSITDVLGALKKLKVDAVIIGSDAVLQHHPFLKRFSKGRRKPIFFAHFSEERLFPNPFWGVGIVEHYPVAVMSASSQNSDFDYFFPWTKAKMRRCIDKMKYVSVRDNWTFDMIKSIEPQKQIALTPDPVFAFNQNAKELIPSKQYILEKFELPSNYVLLSFFGQIFSEQYLNDLKDNFHSKGVECVALPMPTGIHFKHSFDFEISMPLNPIDWYSLIKYSSGYVGSNMHPIVVSLHNAVPCFSIDNWGRTNFWGQKVEDGSSKVAHILSVFGLQNYRKPINNGKCDVEIDTIIDSILNFPKAQVSQTSSSLLKRYNSMMSDILESISDD